MAWLSNNKGQLYTIEGIVASALLLGVLLFIIQANSIVAPQTSKISDMKLMERASDVLICLDTPDATGGSMLKTYVENWNGGIANASSLVTPGTMTTSGRYSDSYISSTEPSLINLDNNITYFLPEGVLYRLNVSYYDTTVTPNAINSTTIITEGSPSDNSVVATKLVTLYQNDTPMSNYWKNKNMYPTVVEVKLILWYM
jgi:hypothetical protein